MNFENVSLKEMFQYNIVDFALVEIIYSSHI